MHDSDAPLTVRHNTVACDRALPPLELGQNKHVASAVGEAAPTNVSLRLSRTLVREPTLGDCCAAAGRAGLQQGVVHLRLNRFRADTTLAKGYAARVVRNATYCAFGPDVPTTMCGG